MRNRRSLGIYVKFSLLPYRNIFANCAQRQRSTMRGLLVIVFVGILAGRGVNAVCSNHTTAADCCGDLEECYWDPTCDTKCGAISETSECADEIQKSCTGDPCVRIPDRDSCCDDQEECQWFDNCMDSDGLGTCLRASDGVTCSEDPTDTCGACKAGTNLESCCDMPGCSWLECDGEGLSCKDESDLDGCRDIKVESCDGADAVKVTLSVFWLTLLSIKLVV